MKADAVVIGAGIVGASCAHYLALAGLNVIVVDRGLVASGTTGAGEGNILVSDKEIGAELDLALYSQRLWVEMGERIPNAEFEEKGGIVVAMSEKVLRKLHHTAEYQSTAGIKTEVLDAQSLRQLEPHITHDVIGAVLYPQDSQVQPMLAATMLLHSHRDKVRVLTQTEVLSINTSGDAITSVTTSRGEISTPQVINAAGTWGGDVAALAGVSLPIMPRRGFILVTEPLPVMVHHKVYTAEYLDNVASDDAGLETSTVVEGTRGGTILIGASRERVGFDRSVNYEVISKLAQGAISIFPFLRDVALLRTYFGFRPYCPDHLPVIGPDSRVAGLFHACGHEGAGVGLSAASGKVIADVITGRTPEIDISAFRPDRFEVSRV
jgi:glycine/D-amino acid oxidase-like deaminating enzyme